MLVLTIATLFLLGGCASPERHTACFIGPERDARNLALGNSPDHTAIAVMQSWRSSWPSVKSGYLFEDVSSYTEVILDDQSYYSPTRYGGGLSHQAISVRSGILVR